MEYSSSRDQLSDDDKACFRELTSDNIKRRETFGVDDTSDETRAIPLAIKRHAIEMLNLRQRSEEEKHLLKQEMVSIYDYYVKDKENVAKCVSTMSSIQEEDRNRFEAGSMALLKSEQKLLERKILTIHNSFKECVELPELNLPMDEMNDEMGTNDEQDWLYPCFEESNDSSSSQSEDEI